MYPEGSVAHFLTERWLPAIRSTLRPSSFSGYENQVRNQVVPRMGRIRLEEVGPAELRDLRGKSGGHDELLFSRNDGEPLDPNLVTRAFRDLAVTRRREGYRNSDSCCCSATVLVDQA